MAGQAKVLIAKPDDLSPIYAQVPCSRLREVTPEHWPDFHMTLWHMLSPHI